TSEQTAVSSQVRTIVEAIAAQPRIGRKELADKLIVDRQKSVEAAVSAADEIERAKLALASDLLWLISAGHVIEFNDGSLDLPRAKTKPKEDTSVVAGVSPAQQKENVETAASAEEKEARVEPGAPPAEQNVEAAVSAANQEPN